jgi:hypothetical protein
VGRIAALGRKACGFREQLLELAEQLGIIHILAMCEPVADRKRHECEGEKRESESGEPAHELPLNEPRRLSRGHRARVNFRTAVAERAPTVLNTATMKWRLLSGCLMIALAITAPPALAQSRALQQRLAAAKRVECTFSTLATGDWKGTTPEASVKTAELEALFTDINVDEGTAESASVYGESFISVRYARGYLHFMQISDVGPLFVTTIFPQELQNGRLKAVQVRLEYAATTLPGFTSRPEMYFGDCAVTS